MDKTMYEMIKNGLNDQSNTMCEMYNMIRDKLDTHLMLISEQTEAINRIASAMEKLAGNTNNDLK